MNKLQTNQYLHILFLLLTMAFVLLFDIGNIDGLRQGTEGFYLLISQEMFNDGYFLTPRIVGENHWSKPPLHFWLPMPLKFIFPFLSYLTSSRIAILILSFWGLWRISTWMVRYYKVHYLAFFIPMACTLGFLKYSRIFMMEAPLFIFCTLSALFLFDYLEERKIKDLFKASLFTGLAILIKGPVSFVMLAGGVGLFFIYDLVFNQRNHFKPLVYWTLLSLFLGSLWFIQAYLRYGDEFYQYFFVRENLGKFNAKNYPFRVVFQGLLIFSFPVIVFFKDSLLEIKNSWRKNIDENRIYIFLFFNFLTHFFLWFIPKQKSHHYAIPSLFFFCLLILIPVLKKPFSAIKYPKWILNFTNLLLLLLVGLCISLAFYFPDFEIQFKNGISIFLTLIFFSAGCFFVFKSRNYIHYFFGHLLSICALWIFLVPLFILPVLPEKAKTLIEDEKVSVIFRKPYFIQESLGRKVTIIEQKRLEKDLADNRNDLFVMPEYTLKNLKLSDRFDIVTHWYIWKRGAKSKAIFKALKERNLGQLKDKMILAKQKL